MTGKFIMRHSYSYVYIIYSSLAFVKAVAVVRPAASVIIPIVYRLILSQYYGNRRR